MTAITPILLSAESIFRKLPKRGFSSTLPDLDQTSMTLSVMEEEITSPTAADVTASFWDDFVFALPDSCAKEFEVMGREALNENSSTLSRDYTEENGLN